MKYSILTAAILALASQVAHADTSFSGSGNSGTLSSPSEVWNFNADGGAALTGYLNNWGSPGVGDGVVPSGESASIYGLELTFSGGGTIDAPSIATGNAAACAGSTGGGTTFCTISPDDVWEAFQVSPTSIEFLAQNATYQLNPGQDYFVNVFFDGATPTSFTGEWLTSFSPTPVAAVPEPSTYGLMAIGLGLVAASSRKRKKQ